MKWRASVRHGGHGAWGICLDTQLSDHLSLAFYEVRNRLYNEVGTLMPAGSFLGGHITHLY